MFTCSQGIRDEFYIQFIQASHILQLRIIKQEKKHKSLNNSFSPTPVHFDAFLAYQTSFNQRKNIKGKFKQTKTKHFKI